MPTNKILKDIISLKPKINGILQRPHAGPGIFLPLLLPVAVCLNFTKNKPVKFYELYAVYGVHTFLNVCLALIHAFLYNSIDVKKRFNIHCAVPAFIMFFIYMSILNLDLLKSLCYIIANTIIYFEGIMFLFKAFPKTFTFGEANVVVEGISLFLFSLVLKLGKVLSDGVDRYEYELCTHILQLAVSWIILFCAVPYVIPRLRTKVLIYVWTLVNLACIYFSVLGLLKIDLFIWLLEFLKKTDRIYLIMLWLSCSALAVFVVYLQIMSKKKSNTVIRKIFHGLITVVFLSGTLFDFNLLYFSSGCVFCLFIVLEVFRLLKIPPLYPFLKEGFSVFCDQKDSGGFALTPISLLVGTSLPIWLYSSKVVSKKDHLSLLSGVLSVGIGDTFASIGGKLMGKHKWPGSHKSIEGTIFSIGAQLLFLMALNQFKLVEITSYPFTAIVLTSIVEALTDQIDNIVLPLVMFVLLCATRHT